MLTQSQAEFDERTHCINCQSVRFSELSHGRFSDKPLTDFIAADPSGDDIRPYFETAEWSLVKCNDCSQVFHRRILTDAWNKKRFNEWMSADAIAEFESRLGPKHRRQFEAARSYVEHVLRIEQLTRSIRGDDVVRLLDFGCGWGKFLEVCAQFGFDGVGVDRSNPRAQGANVRIYPSLEAIGEHPKFHVITLFEVLEHLDEPSETLSALAKVIVPGGLLILETPDCTGVTDIKAHYDYLKIHPLEHINAFTRITLKSIAERNGFTLLKKGPAHVTPDVVRVAKREIKHLIGRGDSSTQLYFRKS